MRRTRLMALWCALGILLLLPTNVAAQSSRTFPETNRTVENAFLEFWSSRGGLEIFGLPLSPVYVNQNRRLRQVFERAIFEWHPQNDQANRVQLYRLGDEALDELRFRDSRGDLQLSAPGLRSQMPRSCSGAAICETFAPTRHTAQGLFLTFWRARGGLAVFGYPITEEFRLTTFDGGTYTVQFFERARLEFHPEIGGGVILISRLGAPIWEEIKEGFTEEDNGEYRVPPYSSVAPFLGRA